MNVILELYDYEKDKLKRKYIKVINVIPFGKRIKLIKINFYKLIYLFNKKIINKIDIYNCFFSCIILLSIHVSSINLYL